MRLRIFFNYYCTHKYLFVNIFVLRTSIYSKTYLFYAQVFIRKHIYFTHKYLFGNIFILSTSIYLETYLFYAQVFFLKHFYFTHKYLFRNIFILSTSIYSETYLFYAQVFIRKLIYFTHIKYLFGNTFGNIFIFFSISSSMEELQLKKWKISILSAICV